MFIILECLLFSNHSVSTLTVNMPIVTSINNEQELLIQSLEQNEADSALASGTIYEIPDYPGKKTFMNDTVFGKSTKQYKLQQKAVKDENGFKLVNNRYCIAIGTRFNTAIGQYVDLVLANSTTIPCVVGDIKSDKHTDTTHTFSKNKCCSEFIVHLSDLDNSIKKKGDVSFINELWQSPVKYIVVYQIKEDL